MDLFVDKTNNQESKGHDQNISYKALTSTNKKNNNLVYKKNGNLNLNDDMKQSTFESLNISTYDGNNCEDNDGLLIKVNYGSAFHISPINHKLNMSNSSNDNESTNHHECNNDQNLELEIESTNHAISSAVKLYTHTYKLKNIYTNLLYFYWIIIPCKFL